MACFLPKPRYAHLLKRDRRRAMGIPPRKRRWRSMALASPREVTALFLLHLATTSRLCPKRSRTQGTTAFATAGHLEHPDRRLACCYAERLIRAGERVCARKKASTCRRLPSRPMKTEGCEVRWGGSLQHRGTPRMCRGNGHGGALPTTAGQSSRNHALSPTSMSALRMPKCMASRAKGAAGPTVSARLLRQLGKVASRRASRIRSGSKSPRNASRNFVDFFCNGK